MKKIIFTLIIMLLITACSPPPTEDYCNKDLDCKIVETEDYNIKCVNKQSPGKEEKNLMDVWCICTDNKCKVDGPEWI